MDALRESMEVVAGALDPCRHVCQRVATGSVMSGDEASQPPGHRGEAALGANA